MSFRVHRDDRLGAFVVLRREIEFHIGIVLFRITMDVLLVRAETGGAGRNASSNEGRRHGKGLPVEQVSNEHLEL